MTAGHGVLTSGGPDLRHCMARPRSCISRSVKALLAVAAVVSLSDMVIDSVMKSGRLCKSGVEVVVVEEMERRC